MIWGIALVALTLLASLRTRDEPLRITRARRRSLRKNRYVLPGERS